jgi:hypothetical protein
MGALARFLELVRRELGAEDARIELGGRDPDDARIVWVALPDGGRLVALLAVAPEDAERLRDRMRALADTFADTIASGVAEHAGHPTKAHFAYELDDALEVLARSTGATDAVVIDERSPVIWGGASPRGSEDADVASWVSSAAQGAARAGMDLADLAGASADDAERRLAAAKLGAEDRSRVLRALPRIRALGPRDAASLRRLVLVLRAIANVRRDPAAEKALPSDTDALGWIARRIGGIYHLVLVFDGAFSELHAEATLIRALPVIERLVVGLPPVDPSPSARGQVVRLFGPR